jgi:hypothetical protein
LELVHALETWITSYNEQYLHAALGDKSPVQCAREYHSCPSPPFAAA